MEDSNFGYPHEGCEKCKCLPDCKLSVSPYYRSGCGKRMMIIGQDPTIFRKQERVKYALMLDDENSQLSRWLRGFIGEKNYRNLTLYGTNAVKCTLKYPPSMADEGGLKFLTPYFEHCKVYLKKEVKSYKPDIVITLGEPAHKLFRTVLDDISVTSETMKEAFNGRFVEASIGGVAFLYSPCLHIKTFRVAETYGNGVINFKNELGKHF